MTWRKEVLVGGAAVFLLWACSRPIPQRATTAERSEDIARMAYDAAARDFAGRDCANRYKCPPNIAPYSSGTVTEVDSGKYVVSVTYEGWDVYGRPEPKIASYSIEHRGGLFMVTGGPRLPGISTQ